MNVELSCIISTHSSCIYRGNIVTFTEVISFDKNSVIADSRSVTTHKMAVNLLRACNQINFPLQ